MVFGVFTQQLREVAGLGERLSRRVSTWQVSHLTLALATFRLLEDPELDTTVGSQTARWCGAVTSSGCDVITLSGAIYELLIMVQEK